jgi:hypothetical protein
MPTAAERLIWGFGTEQDTKVVKARIPATQQDSPAEDVILSGAICWENMMVSDCLQSYNIRNSEEGKR